MPYAAGLSQLNDAKHALRDVAADIQRQLGGVKPDLAFLFVSPHHAQRHEALAQLVIEATESRLLLGCTGETIVGMGSEVEEGPALSLWCAALPGAELETFHVEFEATPDGPLCTGLPEPSERGTAPNAVLMLADPFSTAVDTLIARLADDYPGIPLLGGMASGGRGPGENRLYLNRESKSVGGVGVIIRGGPRIQSVVSQGCRPIGTPMIITNADANVIVELGGKPALVRLQETFAELSEPDRKLLRGGGLHVGVVMDEHKPNFERGDFLISNVLGGDQNTGAIALGNFVRTGQTVQFHVRDADTADEDLRHHLGLVEGPGTSRGALLFSCNGRGTRMFPAPNHDASVIQELCGPIPLAGFFAQGELGPVGGRNYIHGFTASVAVFED